MRNHRAAMLAGASAAVFAMSPMAQARAPQLKDEAGLAPEVKEAVDKLGSAFEAFKAKNDQRLEQLSKGREDAVTKDEVEKINKGIEDLKVDVQKQLDEVFKKANRAGLSGAGADELEAKAAGDFGKLVGKSDFSVENLREYKGDLDHYLRTLQVKATTLSVGNDPSGGYLVTPDVSGRMIKKVYESSPMRQLASVVSIGTDALEGPIDNGEAEALWVGEQQERKQTEASTFGKWTIPVNELYAYPWLTQKLIEDANIDIEAWLAEKAASKFARKETTAFYTGDGILKPKGILSYAYAATDDANRPWGTFEYVPSGHATAFPTTAPADALIDLIFALKAEYRTNARFQMARKTMGAIRKMKDGDGNYLVDLRLRDGALVETIFGFPNVDAEDMPVVGAGALPIAFGDWAETYTIVDRLGVSVVRDNITKPGFVKFHFRKRVGGGAINFESAKFLKIGAS